MGKNRVTYAVLFFLALTFVYFYGGKMPYMTFYAVLLLPAVSALFTLIVYVRFKLVQEIDRKFIMKGDKINFSIKVSNEDFFLYPYLRVLFFGDESVFKSEFQARDFSVLPRTTSSISMEINCKYRGTYPIGAKAIEIEDLLGVFKFRYPIREPKYVTVYPRIIHLDRFRIPVVFLSDTPTLHNTRFEDYTTISDVRKYHIHDSFKRIHWKLTAKKNELMVKNFQSTAETSAIVVLDLFKTGFTDEQNALMEDKVIECAVAVISYCLKNSLPVDLVYFDEEIRHTSAKNMLDFGEIYKVCSGIQFSSTVHGSDLLNVYISEQSYRTNVIMFTHKLDYKLYDELCKIRAVGFEVILVYVSSDELLEERPAEVDNILLSLPESNITYYVVNISDDIKDVLER